MAWQLWIGPAIVAAVISSLISVAGWIVSYNLDHRRERVRRLERVRDFLIALRAEIRSELHNLKSTDFEAHYSQIKANYSDETYSVSVSTPAPHVVFDAIVKEIQILPAIVIDPIVIYTRQRHAIESLVGDMRSERFSKLPSDRQLAMYRDYIDLKKHLLELAETSVEVLSAALGRSELWVNSRGEVLSDLQSASDTK